MRKIYKIAHATRVLKERHHTEMIVDECVFIKHSKTICNQEKKINNQVLCHDMNSYFFHVHKLIDRVNESSLSEF